MTDLHTAIQSAVCSAIGTDTTLPDLAFEPAGAHFEFDYDSAGQFLRIAYMAYDPLPPRSFWDDNGEKGVLRGFRVTSTRERFLRRLEADGGYGFDVESFNVEGQTVLRTRPVGKTTSGKFVGVYALPDVMASKVRAGELTIPRAMAFADALLQDYAAWSKGESCGVVVERYSVGPLGLEVVDHEASWLVVHESRGADLLPGVLDTRSQVGFRP